MKVKNEFYCIKEKKVYKEGDEYTGNRTDLGAFLEAPKKTKELKTPIEKSKPIAKKAVKKTTKKKK